MKQNATNTRFDPEMHFVPFSPFSSTAGAGQAIVSFRWSSIFMLLTKCADTHMERVYPHRNGICLPNTSRPPIPPLGPGSPPSEGAINGLPQFSRIPSCMRCVAWWCRRVARLRGAYPKDRPTGHIALAGGECCFRRCRLFASRFHHANAPRHT